MKKTQPLDMFLQTLLQTFLHTYTEMFLHMFIQPFMATFINTFIRTFMETFLNNFILTYLQTFVPSYYFCLFIDSVNKLYNGEGTCKYVLTVLNNSHFNICSVKVTSLLSTMALFTSTDVSLPTMVIHVMTLMFAYTHFKCDISVTL